MTLTSLLFLCLLAPAGGAPRQTAAAPARPATPFASESLEYTINWPSGLSLGEARMQAGRSGDEWRFELALDASLPGFTITDSFRSTAAGEFCSREFVRESVHGKRKTNEKTTYDESRRVAVRETVGGGKSELEIPSCARDGLAFLYFMRNELAQGRLPAPQTVYFGGPYRLRVEYAGTQSVRANDRLYTTDRIVASFKGPASSATFEVFFARDAARTPVIVRVPFPLGSFSMELAP